jgi:hypothetical protein
MVIRAIRLLSVVRSNSATKCCKNPSGERSYFDAIALIKVELIEFSNG